MGDERNAVGKIIPATNERPFVNRKEHERVHSVSDTIKPPPPPRPPPAKRKESTP